MKKIIAVVGGTGNLGERIVKSILERGAEVRVIVRHESDNEKINKLEKLGAHILRVNMMNVNEIANACRGVVCVVSALNGLRDVIVDAQIVLLDAAIKAEVPHFIP